MYTIKQLADLTHITVRTLHHYDKIGLFKPTRIAENGYRYYDESALLQLQQILFYRELGFELAQIRDIIYDEDFDIVAALYSHKHTIQARKEHLNHLLTTIDETLAHVQGGAMMDKKKMFAAFDAQQQKEYEREIRLQYDPETVNESRQRWNNYSQQEQNAIIKEGNELYSSLARLLGEGKSATDEAIQTLLAQWHEHLRNFYEPSLEILGGLGALYVSDERFAEKFRVLHPDLPEFLQEGIEHYVDVLETEAIQRLLAEDDDVQTS